MSGYGTKAHASVHKESADYEMSADDCGTTTKSSYTSSWGGLGCQDPSLLVAAVVLFIIFSIGIYAGFTWMCGGKNSKSRSEGFGGCGGMLGAGLLWLIVIIIFFVAVWQWGWAAIAGFLVFILLLIIVAWWACTSWC